VVISGVVISPSKAVTPPLELRKLRIKLAGVN